MCRGALHRRILAEIYHQGRYNSKFVPVIFQDFDLAAVPITLADLGCTRLDGKTWGSIDELHARLLDIPLWELPAQPAEIVQPALSIRAVSLPPDV